MEQQKSPHISSDKLIWSQIYRTLKEMLKSQQSQIETLINDREFLENSAYIQHEHWSSRARFLESHIAQMKNEQAKTRLVEDAKMGVLVGFKESEALCYKMQFELAESDLEEFCSCVEVLCAEMEELKEKLKGFGATEVKKIDYMIEHPGSSEDFNGKNQLTLSLKKEIKKLKHAYKELSSRRDSEVSALLAEKDFVWNQFRKMESDYIALFKSKRTEADCQDREATEKLQDNSAEKLQQAINKKDEIIIKLEAERSILQLDVRKHAEEAEKANNKMKRLHTDIDELRLEVMEKEKLIDNLRKEICNLKTDMKKNSLEKCVSEGKFKNASTTIRQIHPQRCSKRRILERCDTHASQKLTNSCGVTCETPASDNVHLDFRKHAEEAEKANNKMKRVHTDIDELHLEVTEKEKLIDNLRKETCNLKTNLKKNSLEKSIFEGKFKNASTTIRQIHLQRCSKRRILERCDTHASQKLTNSCGVTCETPASDIVHKRDRNLTETKRRLLSPLGMQALLFHSDFRVPKLKKSKLLIP